MGSILPVTLIGVVPTFLRDLFATHKEENDELTRLVRMLEDVDVNDLVLQTREVTAQILQLQRRQSSSAWQAEILTGTVNDLISSQTDPDYQRAEASRQKMTAYALPPSRRYPCQWVRSLPLSSPVE